MSLFLNVLLMKYYMKCRMFENFFPRPICLKTVGYQVVTMRKDLGRNYKVKMQEKNVLMSMRK
jgi:hypothetical protein